MPDKCNIYRLSHTVPLAWGLLSLSALDLNSHFSVLLLSVALGHLSLMRFQYLSPKECQIMTWHRNTHCSWFSQRLSNDTTEHCDITALFDIFLEINKHQNLMRPRHPIVINTPWVPGKVICHSSPISFFASAAKRPNSPLYVRCWLLHHVWWCILTAYGFSLLLCKRVLILYQTLYSGGNVTLLHTLEL